VRKYLRFLLWSALVIGVIVGALRLLLLKTWVIPSDDQVMAASLAPSLSPGDVVLVMHAGNRAFGDLVRCADPEAPRRWVIARIAGEPGDNVVIEGANIKINEKKASLETACADRFATIEDPNSGSPVDIQCDIEILGGVTHKRGQRPGQEIERVERIVPQGKVWLLSDNRSYPLDSRTYGAIDPATCDATVVFRLWSARGFFDVGGRFTFVK
jgi:signal peptidase I